MRCLINQRNDSERYLHDAAEAPLGELRSTAKKEPGKAASIVAGLTGKNGAVNLDHLTKTKTVESIMSLADEPARSKIVSHFRTVILNPSVQDQPTADSQRRALADLLASVVRSHNVQNPFPPAVESSGSWLRELLLLFVDVAYFVHGPTGHNGTISSVPISDGVRSVFQSRLSSCLAHILTHKLDERNFFPFFVVSSIRSTAKSEDSSELVLQADKNVTKALKRGHKTLSQIAAQVKIFCLIHWGFQLILIQCLGVA